jgi:hypothetical protein
MPGPFRKEGGDPPINIVAAVVSSLVEELQSTNKRH